MFIIILVQFNTSLSKNHVPHSVTSLSDWLNVKKTSLFAFSMHIDSVAEQGFFHEFAFDNKALKTFVGYSNLLKTFKVQKLSNLNLNFVTCLVRASRTPSRALLDMRLHSSQAAASLIYSPAFCCRPG